MDLFTYLMAKNGQNTHKDLFSYLLGKGSGGGGTYTTYTGTSLNISNTIKAKIKNFILNSTELTQDGTPTPDNPVDVNVITGDNNVKIQNKNLLNKELIVSTNVGNWEVEQIDTGVKITHKSNFSTGEPILTLNLKPNTTYTYRQLTNENGGVGIKTTNGSYSYVSTGSITKTTESDGVLIILYGTSQGSGVICDYTNIQLEEGSTATEYTKHQEQNYPITLSSKNLAYTGWAQDFVSRISNSSYARLETFENRNCLFFDRRAGYNEYDTKYIFKINWKENTQYTFTFDFKNSANSTYANMEIAYTDDTVTEFVGTKNTEWDKIIVISEANKTIKYLKARWRSNETYIDLDTFMVLEGVYTAETVPDYEPYYNLEYCKIGDYADQIFKNTTNTPYYDNTLIENEWYLKKKIGKIDSYNGETITTPYVSTTGGLDTGATIYYGLAVPTYIHISETDYPTLKGQLDNLYNNAKSYDEQTNITQTNDDLPFNISVDVKVANL